MEVTLAELIDRLTIVNLKIFMQLNIVEDSASDEQVAQAARRAQTLNQERSRLKSAIDKFAHGRAEEIKMYGGRG